MPSGRWVYHYFQIDNIAKVASAFRYYFATSTTLTTKVGSSTPSPPREYYSIDTTAMIYWGRDEFINAGCDCRIRFLRLYLNYYVSNPSGSVPYLSNFAFMSPDSKLITILSVSQLTLLFRRY